MGNARRNVQESKDNNRALFVNNSRINHNDLEIDVPAFVKTLQDLLDSVDSLKKYFGTELDCIEEQGLKLLSMIKEANDGTNTRIK